MKWGRGSRWGLCAALWLGLSGVPQAAGAAIYIVPYGPLYPYQPIYFVPEPYVQVDHKNYALSVAGLSHLCRARPVLCAAPAQRAQLRQLRNRRTLGVGLLVGGIGAAVAGIIWSSSSLSVDPRTGASRFNAAPLYAGLGLGVALPVAGAIVVPHSDDIIDYLSGAQGLHPETPIEIHLSGAPQQPRGLSLAWRF